MNTMAGLDKGEFRRSAQGWGSSSPALGRLDQRYIIQRRGCEEGMTIRLTSERNFLVVSLGLRMPIHTPRRVCVWEVWTEGLDTGGSVYRWNWHCHSDGTELLCPPCEKYQTRKPYRPKPLLEVPT